MSVTVGFPPLLLPRIRAVIPQRRTYCLADLQAPDTDLSVSKQIESLQTEMELR